MANTSSCQKSQYNSNVVSAILLNVQTNSLSFLIPSSYFKDFFLSVSLFCSLFSFSRYCRCWCFCVSFLSFSPSLPRRKLEDQSKLLSSGIFAMKTCHNVPPIHSLHLCTVSMRHHRRNSVECTGQGTQENPEKITLSILVIMTVAIQHADIGHWANETQRWKANREACFLYFTWIENCVITTFKPTLVWLFFLSSCYCKMFRW